MASSTVLRVRRSIREMQAEYDAGDKQPLEDLMRAWIGIKNLPPTDPQSFFVLAGYHGEPFKYRREVDELSRTNFYTYWGGYCNHGNVLFPTWHRVYVLKVEEALQSIVPGVSMPYWDETHVDAIKYGIPSILTQPKFMLDGILIDNPLRSFVLPKELGDDLRGDMAAYEKPLGYQTVRYPLSGLVGNAKARAQTESHNALYPNDADNTGILNANVVAWMKGLHPTVIQPNPPKDGILDLFNDCLQAPNYTVFSNTTSAKEWNRTYPGMVTSLEAPHNDIHLSVGGFDAPGGSQSGQIAGANGDMGENNTAAMDPIFFFHHCNIDRVFWLWQKRHGQTAKLTLIDGYSGTSSNDNQGPTPGVMPGAKLTLQTSLTPFERADGSAYISDDCVDIENQLGFTYSQGSLDEAHAGMQLLTSSGRSGKKLDVSNIDRAMFQGSFVVKAYANVKQPDGSMARHYLGHQSVLSRYNVVACANCLTHMEVVAHFPLSSQVLEAAEPAQFEIEIQHRAPPPASNPNLLSATAGLTAAHTASVRVID